MATLQKFHCTIRPSVASTFAIRHWRLRHCISLPPGPDIAKPAKQSRNYQPKDKFRPGQQVFVQDQHDKRWIGGAVIIRRGRNQQEFIIRMSSGVEQHRNRRSPRLGPSPRHEPIKVAPQHERTSCEGNARSSSSAPIQLRSILKKTGTFQEPPWSQKG